jgi:hypothetical protein
MNMKSLSLALHSLGVYVPLIKVSSLDLIKKSILFNLFNVGIIIVEQVTRIPIQL